MSFFDRLRNRLESALGTEPSDRERSDMIEDYLAEQIREGDPGLALAVVSGGQAVYAAGYGLANLRGAIPIAPDTMFHLASCGKQFSGVAVLMLAEEGKLNPDDPIGEYLPELAGFGTEVTIRELLHHTSGIRDLYDESGVQEVLARCERPTNADVIKTYVELGCPMAGRRIKPGDQFNYSNSSYELVGSVIERVSGMSYHDFFQQRVFDPLAMKDTFSVPDRRTKDRRCAVGYDLDDANEFVENSGSDFDGLVGSGSFYTTVNDLCLYERGLRSHRLIGEASMEEVFTGGETADGNPTDYGFGWYVGEEDGIAFAEHEGSWNGFQSYIRYYIDEPFAVFVLSNHPDIVPLDVANVAIDAYGTYEA